MKYAYFYLTCANNIEADKITNVLLRKQLVACVKQHVVDSSFLWRGKIDKSTEIMLTMESAEELFEKVESEVRKLHSYDTYVLTCVRMSKISVDAAKWLSDSLIDLDQ